MSSVHWGRIWNFGVALLWILARACWWLSGSLRVVVWARGGVASVVEGLVGSSEWLEWTEGSGLVLDRSCGKVFVVESLV